MKYVVRISSNPNREELKWAMKFTVRMRDDYTCQNCGQPGKDIAHVLSRADRPDLEFEPSNARVLCRRCHLRADHANGHRPSGRPFGHMLSEETKAKIGASNARVKADPEWRRQASERGREQWDARGRKPPRDCEHCEAPLSQKKLSANARFCGAACSYAFRKGKPRAGW